LSQGRIPQELSRLKLEGPGGKSFVNEMSVSQTFQLILELVARQKVTISNHGYDELAEDGILVTEIIVGVRNGTVVEDYSDYPKGPMCAGLAMG
jgi:hypothetical protein